MNRIMNIARRMPRNRLLIIGAAMDVAVILLFVWLLTIYF